MYLGIDGAPDGWLAVAYDDTTIEAELYDDITAVWAAYEDRAEVVLIDVPIGLRETDGRPRPCDAAARDRLSPHRHASVFSVPIRAAVHESEYAAGKAIQEAHTDRSIGVQTWQITDLIAEVDAFLRATPDAVGRVRESHPEVCFWALNGKEPTAYSKTGQPAAAVWERIGILETVDPAAVQLTRAISTDLDAEVGTDDVLDALVLAVSASQPTGALRTLPERWPAADPGDPTGLPMEIVYPTPVTGTEQSGGGAASS